MHHSVLPVSAPLFMLLLPALVGLRYQAVLAHRHTVIAMPIQFGTALLPSTLSLRKVVKYTTRGVKKLQSLAVSFDSRFLGETTGVAVQVACSVAVVATLIALVAYFFWPVPAF